MAVKTQRALDGELRKSCWKNKQSFCGKCRKIKHISEFYVSNLSKCAECISANNKSKRGAPSS